MHGVSKSDCFYTIGILIQSEVNKNQSWLSRTRFPALGFPRLETAACNDCILRVITSSFDRFTVLFVSFMID